MRNLVEFRFTVATAELKGKSIIAVSKVLGKALEKVEPQIMRLVEVATTKIEKELEEE